MSSRRRPARRPRGAPSGGGLPPEQIAYTVLGVAVVVLLLFVFLRKGGDDDPADVAAPVAEPPPKPRVDPKAEARDKVNWWYEAKFLDAYGRVKKLPSKRVAALFAEGEKLGYHQVAGVDWEKKKQRAYRPILEDDPYHPEGNRAFGKVPLSDYPEFWSVFRRLGDHLALPPEYEAFRDDMEERIQTKPTRRAPPLSAEEFAAAKRLLDEFLAWDGKLRENPIALKILEARKRIELDPLLGRYDTVHIEVPPFILFYAVPRTATPKKPTPLDRKRAEEGREKFRARLRSYQRLIDEFVAYFRKMWMEPLQLKDFDPDQLFFIWVFGDRESWEEYGRISGVVHPPGLLGYFNPRDHWVFLFEDRKERLTVETSLAHEMTHQLHWHFSEDPESEFKNHLSRIKAVWFQEGWAEYAGRTKRDANGYRFGQTASDRVKSLRLLQKLGLPFFPVRDLVKRTDYQEWIRYALLEWLPKQKLKVAVEPERLVGVFMEVLYAQSWLLVSFLYEFDNGKYREKALRFTAASLKGYLGYRGARGYARAHEVFAEILELRTDADWNRLQKEYDRYMEDKFYEVR